MDKHKKGSLNLAAFIPAMIILAAFLLVGFLAQDKLAAFLDTLFFSLTDNLGWYINLLALFCLILIIVFVIYKYGDIRIGGKDAKPEFKTFNWCAMTICSGIGTGLLFWGMGEPIFHFMSPPVAANVEPGSRSAAIFAVSQAMWGWSFVQYAIYSLIAVAFAVVTYNMKKKLSFGSLIEGVFKRKIPWLESLIHGILILCMCLAMANSMGVGLLQIAAGLEAAFGIPQSAAIFAIIAVVMAVIFILSCVSGLGTGLKKISSITIYLFIALMIYVLIFGDTQFIGKITAESFGHLLNNMPEKTTILNTMAETDTWSADWILQYWCQFFVFGTLIGMFLSRMARGRTIREFVLVNVLVPSLFCCIWIGIFGGMTISLQTNGIVDVWEAVNTLGMQTTIFQIIGSLPFGSIVTVIFLVTICFSFCTLADPMASAVSTVSVHDASVNDEPPRKIKILVGVIMTAAAFIQVESGGTSNVRGMYIVIGVITSFIVILCVMAAFKFCHRCVDQPNWGVIEDMANRLETEEEQNR